MKTLSLRPYHGVIHVFDNHKELRKAYKRLTKVRYPYEDGPNDGRYIKLEFKTPADTEWLVYATNTENLAHEFSHILLHTFRLIGHDPREGDGEPFCYMLSQLLIDAK